MNQTTTDRKKAFSRFLLYYILSTSVIALIIFFGMKVPEKENERMKTELALLKSEQSFNEQFFQQVQGIKGLLDSVNMAGVQAEVVDADITNRLAQLKAMSKSDGAAGKGQYEQIANMLLEFQSAKKTVRGAGAKDATLGESQRQIEKLQNDLKDCNVQLQLAKMQAAQAQPH